jgi:ATP phosphoribosyltransferase regulatory subunit
MTTGGLNPGLWTEETARLRAMERNLLELWAGAGFLEVMPPLFLPEAAAAISPEALLPRTQRLSTNGDGPMALRADFTAGVAWMGSRRLGALPEPLRVCYSGVVARRPLPDRPEGLESLQAGCERVSPAMGPEGDAEMVMLAAASLMALEVRGAVLEIGHWGLVGPLLQRVPWPARGIEALEGAINRKSIPAMEKLGDEFGRSGEWELLRNLIHLGGRPESVDNLLPGLERVGAAGAWSELRSLGELLAREFPSLSVRLEPTDVRHWSYYSGLTVKAFSPRHPCAILTGGRYDGLYPSLGKPFGALGFGVHTGRLLEDR